MKHVSMLRRGLLLLTLLATGGLTAQAQGVTIGAPGAPDASAALEVRSTTQGLLLPRLTTLQRLNIANPAAGLLLFQTDAEAGVYYYDGTVWRTAGGGLPAAFGLVSTLAGSGTRGSADGTGSAAQFSGPSGLAYDGNGNLYVADRGRVRKIVVATGAVSTVAGGGQYGFRDTYDGSLGNPGSPVSVAYDGKGYVFVADQSNHSIRYIDLATGFLFTLAGDGPDGNNAGYVDGEGMSPQSNTPSQARFNTPAGVVCDGEGNLYVADQGNNCIRYIKVYKCVDCDPLRATLYCVVSTLAGNGTVGSADGTVTAARFNGPTSVAFDKDDNLYVTDQGNHRIRKIPSNLTVVTTLAGSTQGYAEGVGTATQFNGPSGVACDSNKNVYVADQGNNRVRVIK